MILKPILPTKYNGDLDLHMFLKFINNATAYLRERGVSQWKCVCKLGTFLTDAAAEFYKDIVQDNAHDWRLKLFFKKLHSYCFLLPYHMEQHQLLKKSFQNDKTVNSTT
ncbi:hypothetical protein IW262DRAFT_1262466 [Armillaria fumosa]|nr:hypothetical protein IW262DRAFT_1262466 [Armillaria fumosa]